MIIRTKATISPHALEQLLLRIEGSGARAHVCHSGRNAVIAAVGDTSALHADNIALMEGVENTVATPKPYTLASRAYQSQPTVIAFGDQSQTKIGGSDIVVMAGPCSVEGRQMITDTARAVQQGGARLLRGGAFKPRSSPYAFQGLGEAGLQMLAEVRAATGLPIVTEVMDTRQVELVASYADVLQIGARNMQNFALLREVGRVRRPVLLKRGLSATISELLMAAEYIVASGNSDVILCERGIRTYETATRNTLDIAAIPVLKRETHLPVIVDPSHAGGKAELVTPLAMAAIAAGRRRLDCRSTSRSGQRTLGRRPITDPRAVRADDGASAEYRSCCRPHNPREHFDIAVAHHELAVRRMTSDIMNELRTAIGEVDSAIVALIAERTALARAIGQVKAEEGRPVTDPAREAAVVANAARLAREAGLPEEEVRTLFWQLVALARRAQLVEQTREQNSA